RRRGLLNASPLGRPSDPTGLTPNPSTNSMSTETTTANTAPMSTETTTANPRRLLLALPAVAAILLLVAVWPSLQRKAQQRAQAEEERRRAEAASFGQVQGVVTLDGQPLGIVEVAFLPNPEL